MSKWAFIRDQYTTLPLPQPPTNITEGTYIVTGANTGLGYECAKHLVQMGAARVILGVRSLSKGQAALTTLRNETGRREAGEVWELDLASVESVEKFSKRINQLDRLDALIENAGVAMSEFKLVDGVEMSLQVNVVSTMLLAFRAFPKLQQSSIKSGRQGTVVIVSSGAAIENDMKMALAGLKGDVFDALSTRESFDMMRQYPKTKLLEIYAVRELASLLPVSDSGVIVNYVNPGFCNSELARNAPFALRFMLVIMKLFLARSTEAGSRNLVQAAFAGPESHGAYCSECKIRDSVLPTWVTDEDGPSMQKRVWADLRKKLNSIGYSVDIAALKAGNKGSEVI